MSGLLRTTLATALALVAFAANSLLCRAALRTGSMDAASFTALRLASGALVLLPWVLRGPRAWDVRAALALAVYAGGFSFAYVALDAGTGALLLFGLVQATMVGAGLARGERPGPVRTLGLVAASAGVVWLVLPGVSAPDPVGALLMALAGVAWGVYSLLGRGAARPSRATAANFVMATPVALVLLAIAHLVDDFDVTWTPGGLALAVASGALTSGLGYVVWYAALPGHTATTAAVVQLAVPVLAAVGGVWFLHEEATSRLLVASVLTLGGVALAVTDHGRPASGRRADGRRTGRSTG